MQLILKVLLALAFGFVEGMRPFYLACFCTVFMFDISVCNAVFFFPLLTGVPVHYTNKLALNDDYHASALKNLTSWRANLFHSAISNPTAQEEPHTHERFKSFAPFVSCPEGQNLKRWGSSGDGGKWLCGIEKLKKGCVIYSLGSANVYDFEEAMLESTPCSIHTFDCTVDGHSVSRRHTFHKLCIGKAEKAKEDPMFITYEQAIEENSMSQVDVLKMDIEGGEFDVFSGWRETNANLPLQVSFELHYADLFAIQSGVGSWGREQLSSLQLTVLFAHITNLGYAIVSKEDNPACPHCSEFTLLRIQLPL